MQKKAGLLWLVGVLLCSGCRSGKIGLVPEVSPHLALVEVPNVSLASLPTFFFVRGQTIGVVQSDGRIFLISADPLRLLKAESLPFPMASGTAAQGSLALLQDKSAGKDLLYDLVQQKAISEWDNREDVAILSFDRECRLSRFGGELVVERLAGGVRILRLPADRYPAERIRFGSGLVYGNGENSCFTFSTASAVFQEYLLPVPADSEGFLRGDRFYYGSKQRQLVCFSLAKREAVWKIRLPDQLAFAPFAFRSHIAAVTRGGAVLFLNRRGSVVWWLELPSYARFTPVCLKEHVAFVLENNELFLVNTTDRQATRFSLTCRPDAAPFFSGGYLFFTGSRMGEARKIMRFGNRIEIEISQHPEIPMAGKSVVFHFAVFNLPAPRLAVRLEDATGNTVLEKSITAFQPFSLAWIPPKGGRYLLKVRAEAENATRESSRQFQVIDWREWLGQLMRFRIRLI